MPFSLVNKRLCSWIDVLCLSLLLVNLLPTSRAMSQSDSQNWLDIASAWVESYDAVAQQIAKDMESQSRLDLQQMLQELDRQQEEARLDCLANRLLAEEYHPYDFDIRETMWCKGLPTHATNSLCPAENAANDEADESPAVITDCSLPDFSDNPYLGGILIALSLPTEPIRTDSNDAEFDPSDWDIVDLDGQDDYQAYTPAWVAKAEIDDLEAIDDTSSGFDETSDDRQHVDIPATSDALGFTVIQAPKWVSTIRSHVWSGFTAKLHSDWKFLSFQADELSSTIRHAFAAIQEQRMENVVANAPSLRSVFGRSVLPYEVGLSSEEYTKLAIQLWQEMRANASDNGILTHSLWIKLGSTKLEPFSTLVTRIPSLFSSTLR